MNLRPRGAAAIGASCGVEADERSALARSRADLSKRIVHISKDCFRFRQGCDVALEVGGCPLTRHRPQ
eukprot:1820581-Prymnesium_polylepis.1